MSHITDIILSTSLDNGTDSCIDKINAYLLSKYGSYCSLKQVDQLAGGAKSMQCDLFIGAVNHMDINAFLDFFQSLNWYAPEYIQLMLKDEHDEGFTIHEPKI